MTYFDYPSNFSNGTKSVTGPGSLLAYGSAVTGGLLGPVFLVIIWVVAFVLGGADKKAGASATFIMFLFSVLFLRVNLVSPIVPIVSIIFLFVILMINAKSNY